MKQKYLDAYTDYINNPFLTLEDACIKHGFCRSAFHQAIRKEGLVLPKKVFKTTCPKEKLQRALDLYRSGMSIQKISSSLGMTDKTLSKYLKYKEEPIRDVKARTKDLSADYNYFETIDSEDKAYWYGFIMADGCVINKKSYRLSIELNEIDIKHLEKFKCSIKSNHPIKHRKNRPTVTLTINSKKIVSDLCKLGCVPNKTENGWLALNQIEQKYWKDILRGYLDGDGFIDKQKYRIIYTIKKLQIAQAIEESFKQNKIKSTIKHDKQYCRLNIENRTDFYHTLHYLYDNATIYLDRKYQIYLSRIDNMSPLTEMPK